MLKKILQGIHFNVDLMNRKDQPGRLSPLPTSGPPSLPECWHTVARAQTWLRVLAACVMLAVYVVFLLAAVQVFKGPPNNPTTLAGLLPVSAFFSVLTLAGFMVLNVSVQIRDTDLRLNNLILQVTVPASDIDRFEFDSGLRVRLHSGRLLWVAASQKSLAASLTGARFAKKIAAQLTPWLEHARTVPADPPRAGVHWKLRWSAPAVMIAWILFVVVSDSVGFELAS